MAALHAVTVTCPACAAPITVPVILTTVRDTDQRTRGAYLLVTVRADNTPVREHHCDPDQVEAAS